MPRWRPVHRPGMVSPAEQVQFWIDQRERELAELRALQSTFEIPTKSADASTAASGPAGRPGMSRHGAAAGAGDHASGRSITPSRASGVTAHLVPRTCPRRFVPGGPSAWNRIAYPRPSGVGTTQSPPVPNRPRHRCRIGLAGFFVHGPRRRAAGGEPRRRTPGCARTRRCRSSRRRRSP